MKRLSILCALFAGLALASLAAQPAAPVAEITFTFARQSGAASNQFAVWVEDAQGKYIKTLYATRYTANGGWKRRETSIPVWVKQSNLAGMNKTQIDAVTAATPKNGTLTYAWDGADSRGAAVPAGDYVVVLEATLRWENQVYYRAPVRLGQGAAAAEVNVEYIGTPPAGEKAMISSVVVRALR